MRSPSDKENEIYSKFLQNCEDGWIAYAIYKKEEFDQIKEGKTPSEITESKIREYQERTDDFIYENFSEKEAALNLTEKKDTIELRRKYATKVSCIVIGWLAFVMVMLVVCSLNWFRCILTPLDNKVLIALIGGSSVNIIGLLAIILKGLDQHL